MNPIKLGNIHRECKNIALEEITSLEREWGPEVEKRCKVELVDVIDDAYSEFQNSNNVLAVSTDKPTNTAEVESRTQRSRPRPSTQKNRRPRTQKK